MIRARRGRIECTTYRSIETLDKWRHTASAVIVIAFVDVRTVESISGESRWTSSASE